MKMLELPHLKPITNIQHINASVAELTNYIPNEYNR